MPPTMDNKIWNEDLVKGLRAREELCRQRCSVRQYLWRDGARALEAVRHDIYQYKGSRKIVGIPRDLAKTIEDECRAIIEGEKPVLPKDYTPTTTEEKRLKEATNESSSPLSNTFNPYYNDPYLKRIKMRGGSYAILMALHHSQAKVMTKVQLCAAAQAYCDDEMEPNFSSGRSYGAWNSKKTLINHALISEHRSTQMGRRGYMCNGVSEYSLTQNGRLFINAMIQKFHMGRDFGHNKLNDRHETAFQLSLTAVNKRKPHASQRKVEGIDEDQIKWELKMDKNYYLDFFQADVVNLVSDSDSESDCKNRRNPIQIKKSQAEHPTISGKGVLQSRLDYQSRSRSFDSDKKLLSNSTFDNPIDFENCFDEGKKLLKDTSRQDIENISKSPLYIFIDNRERNRNATPRHMRMELIRHLTHESG